MGSSIKSMFGKNSEAVSSNSSSSKLSFSKMPTCVRLRNVRPPFLMLHSDGSPTWGELCWPHSVPSRVQMSRPFRAKGPCFSFPGWPSIIWLEWGSWIDTSWLMRLVPQRRCTGSPQGAALLSTLLMLSLATHRWLGVTFQANPALLWQVALPIHNFWKLFFSSGVA